MVSTRHQIPAQTQPMGRLLLYQLSSSLLGQIPHRTSEARKASFWLVFSELQSVVTCLHVVAQIIRAVGSVVGSCSLPAHQEAERRVCQQATDFCFFLLFH